MTLIMILGGHGYRWDAALEASILNATTNYSFANKSWVGNQTTYSYQYPGKKHSVEITPEDMVLEPRMHSPAFVIHVVF